MVAERDIELLQDRALADSARRGGRAAFDELYRRHALASWRLAVAVTRHPDAAGDAVVGAFAAALAHPGDAAGASGERFRLTLLRATRRAAIDAVGERSTARPVTGPLPLEPGEPRAALVRQAFDTLPERWRTILWLVDVEGCSMYDAARVLELAPAAVAPLIERARLGLREEVLHAGLRRPSPQDCRRTTDRLTGYVAGSLAERDEARVRSHLDGCAACRDRLAALDDLVPVLRGATLAFPLLLVDDAVRRWSTSLVRDTGPLHLAMPSGQPMPAWAQRAFAGTVAAVVALGITGATMIAGRGRGSARDGMPRPVADGESALADPGLSDLLLDGPGFVWPSVGTGPGSDATTPPGGERRSGDPLPRSTASPTAPIAGSTSPAPTLPPGSSTLPTGPPSPPPEEKPPLEADALATVGVGDVAGVTVGEECSGGQVLGVPIACPPPATADPVTVDGTAVPSL